MYGWEPAGCPVERRASLRFQWKGTASIRILPDGPDVLGVLLDVSEGGCGIELGMAIPAQVGAKVPPGRGNPPVRRRRRDVLLRQRNWPPTPQ